MRKFLLAAAAVAVAWAPCVSHAQSALERPKIAVYVFGADHPDINKAMTTRLIAELANTGRFSTSESYREFFEKAAAEPKGNGGLISSKQIRALGQRFGVKYVCVAEIVAVSGLRQVSAHILGVEGGEVLAVGGGDVALKTFADLTIAAEQIVKAMFNAAPPGHAQTPAPASAAANAPSAAFTDPRDGKVYKTVTLGGQTWTAQNLNYQAAAGSWCYGNDNSNCNRYGRLYDRYTAGTACPNGWHLPTRQEWDALVAAAGGPSAAGKKLKSAGGWSIGGSGMDDYGFSALPGGSRNAGGDFHGVGGSGYWWTTAMGADNSACYRYMHHDSETAGEHYESEGQGFSVRCVKDGAPGR